MIKNMFSEKVSTSKKTLTAVFVVGVLLFSALVINSIQQKTNLQAQSGFLVRTLSNLIGSRLDPLKNIPNDNLTFSSESAQQNNAILFTEEGQPIIDFNNLDSIKNSSATGSSSGFFILPEDKDPLGVNSYIVTFKADPIAEKAKNVLASQGKEILPGEKNKEALKQDLQKIKPQIDSQKTLIANQQNGLLTKVGSEFGDVKSTRGSVKVYNDGQKEVTVRQLKSAINAVTISNVTEDEIKQLTRGVSNIERIEKAQLITADLTDTAEIINTEQLQQYLGANGVPLTGQGTIIGVVDTGVDYTHQDLGSCSFLLEAGCKVAYGYDFVNNDPDPMDDQGHGTHVAATAAGNGYYTQSNGNTQPLLGIAPDATIYAFKVLGANGSGSNVGVIAAMEACVDPNGDGDISDRVTVCTLSLGSANGNPTDATSLAADAAVDAGVIMTIAAGNDGPGPETIGSPGTSRKAITVGAACKPSQVGNDALCNEAVASFSSRGPVLFSENGQNISINKPDVVSPGVSICAAQWGDWLQGKSCLGDNQHIAINGTSMATPTVAGLMALLAQAHPEKSVAELKEALMTSATDLNLPVSVQGQGLVDGQAALETLGIPNAFVQIQGLPFNVNDTGNSQTASYSKQLTLTNTSNTPLNLTATRVTSNAGVDLTFPGTVSIPVGGQQNFNITMGIDHTQAISGNTKETIKLMNGSESVNLTISRKTPDYLTTNKTKLDFGLFHASQANFSATLPIQLTNRMNFQGETYDVVIDESLIQTPYQDNITVTPSSSQITLNAGQQTTLNVSMSALSATGNILPNKEYKVILKLVSDKETIPIELTLFRGYSFELYYGNVVPDMATVSGSTWQLSYVPNPQAQSMIFKTTQQGPYHAIGIYTDNQSGFQRLTTIYQHDIGLNGSTGVVTYDISKNKAEHRIENTYSGNACVFRTIPDTGEWSRGLTSSIGGKIAVEYNTIPENMHFSLICGDLMPANDRIIFSQIYLTEGLNQDFSLNNNTADISTRYMYGFDNREGEDTLSLGINICNFRSFRENGEVDSRYNLCNLWQYEGGGLNIEEGGSAIIEVRSLHTDTPETAEVPSYPAFRIHALSGTGTPADEYMYVTPEMFGTSEKMFAWAPGMTGALTTSQSTLNYYQTHKIPLVNDDFITVGTGPVVDTSSIKAFKDDFGFVSGRDASYFSMYRYADGTTESAMSQNPNPTKARINFFRDGQLVKTVTPKMDSFFEMAGSNIPDEEGDLKGNNYGGPVVGDYRIEIDRIGKFNGQEQDGFFSSELEFDISSNIVDSTPPFIKTIQLVQDGILQNNFDPQNPGTLRLYVDPGKGIQSHNLTEDSVGAYNISFMNDSITSITVFAGDSYNQLTALPNPQLTDGYYAVNLGSLVAAPNEYKYFRVEVQDVAGNKIKYNFAIEVGESLTIEDIADELLLVCVKSAPLIAYSPATPLVIAGAPYITFDMSIKNQDSQACAPTAHTVTLKSSQYPPLNSNATGTPKIRMTQWSNTLSPTFPTTTSYVYTNPYNPGATIVRKITVRADAGLANGNYQIGASVKEGQTSSTSPSTELTNLFVDVGVVSDDPIDTPTCTPNTTSVTLNPSQSTIDSGGPVTSFGFTITNNDSAPCSPSSFSLAFDTDQFPASISGTRKIRGSATNTSSFTTTEFTIASGSLNPGQSYTGTGYLRADTYFPNGSYQIGAVLTDTTNNQTQTVPMTVVVNGAETENPTGGTCTRNPATVTPIGLIASHPNTELTTKAYQLSITNNDSTGCPNTTFKVLITEPLDGFGLGKSNLVTPQNNQNKFDHFWSLAPGQTQVKNVFYRNFGSVTDQLVPLTVQVTDITQVGGGSTHTPATLQGSIKFGNPQ